MTAVVMTVHIFIAELYCCQAFIVANIVLFISVHVKLSDISRSSDVVIKTLAMIISSQGLKCFKNMALF